VYNQRNDLMAMDNIGEIISNIRQDVVTETISQFIAPQSLEEQWEIEGLEATLKEQFDIELPVRQWLDTEEKLYEETLRERILQAIQAAYDAKAEQAGVAVLHQFEKQLMLQVLDYLWKEHLDTMDYQRQGIHLRSYGQKNPKQEYKRESFLLFDQLLKNIKQDTFSILSHFKVRQEEEVQRLEEERRAAAAALAERA